MALATIVATTGSTYRHAGARLLVPAAGNPIGNISGGCLEDDVARIGREVIGDGRPRLVSFDLTADDDAVWGYGLGCNGSFEIFVEPTEGAVATAAALPPMRLIVCGAGHDAIPLVRQSAELGWRVTVADVRRALLNADRFPEAADFCDAAPEKAADAIEPDGRSAVLLMSHNYLRDIAYLGSFLAAEWAYLGVLGPRGRTEQMLGELGAPQAIGRLHAPAGLDIGAEGPEEVARSIVAEILAVTRGRAGGPLRDRSGPIHG